MKPDLPPIGGKPPMGMPPPGRPPMGGPGGPPPGWMPPMADISWVKRKFLDVPYASESKSQCFDLYLPEEGDGPWSVSCPLLTANPLWERPLPELLPCSALGARHPAGPRLWRT